MPVTWHDGSQLEVACRHGAVNIALDEDVEAQLLELVQTGCPCLFQLVQERAQLAHDLSVAMGATCFEDE